LEKLNKTIAKDFERLRREKPLIHHITNFVVMNETANITLCLGALPVMAHAREEVEEMVSAAGALLLNIGTLTPELVDSMVIAAKKANELSIPVVLDPVGAGATALRTNSARGLLAETDISIVRGNCAEISILAGLGGKIKGVESIGGEESPVEIAKEFALKEKCTVAITGKEDVVSDGKRVAIIKNGDSMLGTITGTGCMATTVIAGFAAVQNDKFLASIGGLVTFGLAGEHAAKKSGNNPGMFHVALYDSLAALGYNDILTQSKVEIF
jgi:hydroxyethylthiazole kinase